MPSLYIANASSQIWEFTYRLPEATRAHTQTINIGGQTQIPGRNRSIPQTTIDAILEQHRPYGLVSVDEVLRGSHFYGLAYSIDKPVQFEKLQRLVDKYRSILHAQGKEARTRAAIATNEYVENMLFERQLPHQLTALDVSVEEMSRPEGFEGPETSDGVKVIRGDNDPPRPTRARRRS